MYSMHIGIC